MRVRFAEPRGLDSVRIIVQGADGLDEIVLDVLDLFGGNAGDEGVGTMSGATPGTVYEGVTTLLTEHNVSVFLDDAEDLSLGSQVELSIDRKPYHVELKGVVTQVTLSRNATQSVHTVEILDFGNDWGEYLQVLYDRVPTLPQRLTHDPGPVRYFWRNFAARLGRTS